MYFASITFVQVFKVKYTCTCININFLEMYEHMYVLDAVEFQR